MTKTLDELKDDVTNTLAAYTNAVMAWHKFEIAKATSDFDAKGIKFGDRVYYCNNTNTNGIFAGFEFDQHVRPIVKKINKDGTASKLSFYIYDASYMRPYVEASK